jgi:type I restriction enzyme, S subunit
MAEPKLPASWSAIFVEDAVDNISTVGKKIPQKQYQERGTFPIVDQGQESVGGYTDDAQMLIECEPPVIVFGDHTKVVKLVGTRFAAGADGVKVLKPHSFFDCKLLKFFLDHLAADLIDKGYARHFQHLAKRIIPLPPEPEQRRIVAKIEELFSELDKGTENLKQARAQLAVYRQALLKHAFEGKLTADWRASHPLKEQTAAAYLDVLARRRPAPPQFKADKAHSVQTWAFATLDELTEYITSGSRGWADFYSEKGSVFIRAQNLNRDRLDLTEIAYVTLPEKAEGKRTQTRVGDVLVTITGANVTKTGYLNSDIGEAYVSQHVALCRPLDAALSEYLYLYIISSSGGRKDLERAAYGAGKPGLNLDNLRSLKIPVPPREEVPVLVAEIRSSLEVIENLESDIETNLQKAEALRQSILKKAFAGELVPQDPADEPASALLERIRAERAIGSAPAAKTSRRKKKDTGQTALL